MKCYEATHDGILQTNAVWDSDFDIQFWGNSYHRDGQNDDWYDPTGGLRNCRVQIQAYGEKDTSDKSNYCLHLVDPPLNTSFIGCNSRLHKVAEWDVNGGSGNVQAACVPTMSF